MVEDHTLVALIKESLEAPSRNRRLAARVILDVLRNGEDDSGPGLELIEAEAVADVAAEIKDLAKEFHLK